MLSPSLPSSHEPCSHQARPISTAHREGAQLSALTALETTLDPVSVLQITPWIAKELFWGRGTVWVKQY